MVDPSREFGADLEVRQALRLDLDDLAGAWVAALVRLVASDLEGPKPTNFDLRAPTDGLLHAVEDGVHQKRGLKTAYLPLLGDAFDQVGSGHARDSASGIGISARV